MYNSFIQSIMWRDYINNNQTVDIYRYTNIGTQVVIVSTTYLIILSFNINNDK